MPINVKYKAVANIFFLLYTSILHFKKFLGKPIVSKKSYYRHPLVNYACFRHHFTSLDVSQYGSQNR